MCLKRLIYYIILGIWVVRYLKVQTLNGYCINTSTWKHPCLGLHLICPFFVNRVQFLKKILHIGVALKIIKFKFFHWKSNLIQEDCKDDWTWPGNMTELFCPNLTSWPKIDEDCKPAPLNCRTSPESGTRKVGNGTKIV